VFPTLFSAIETCIKTGDLGIKSYGLAMSTLEEVFLETTRRVEAALSNKDDDVDSISDTRDISEKSVLINGADPSAYVSNLTLAGDYDTLAAPTSGHAPAGQQLKALLRTKVISQKRHWKGALCFLLVPLLFVLFSLILTRVSFGQVGDIGSKIWNPDHAVANVSTSYAFANQLPTTFPVSVRSLFACLLAFLSRELTIRRIPHFFMNAKNRLRREQISLTFSTYSVVMVQHMAPD
jgi:hypothetical protein